MFKNKDGNLFNILTDDFLLNIAAGNDGKLLTYKEDSTLSYVLGNKQLDYTFPAWIKTQNSTKNIMLVSSLKEDGTTLRDDSNWNHEYIDIAAPGTNIPIITSFNLKIHEKAFGTTFAIAIVSGTANLMLACNNRLPGAKIKEIILDTADVVEMLKDKIIGGKVLNIERAVKAVCEPEEHFSVETLNKITSINNDEDILTEPFDSSNTVDEVGASNDQTHHDDL